MRTDLSVAVPRTIEFNYDEIMAELDTQLERYRNRIITEDGIKDAKADLAKLRKLKDAFDTKRKDVKKEYLAPFEEFESKVKRVIAKINEPVEEINSQLNRYEEQRKAEKQDKIYDLYHEIVPADVKGILLFDRIFDPRWLNKGVDYPEIEQAITNLTIRVQNDMLAIKEIEPEHAAAVRAEYYRTLDLGAAMRHLTTLRETAAAIKQENPTTNQPEPEKTAEAVQEPQRAPEPQTVPEDDRAYTFRLELNMTKQQAAELKQYLIANGIKFSQIR